MCVCIHICIAEVDQAVSREESWQEGQGWDVEINHGSGPRRNRKQRKKMAVAEVWRVEEDHYKMMAEPQWRISEGRIIKEVKDHLPHTCYLRHAGCKVALSPGRHRPGPGETDRSAAPVSIGGGCDRKDPPTCIVIGSDHT